MFQSEILKMGLSLPALLLAQTATGTDINTAEDAALVFSGPQFFTALIAGVVLAFAFQLLLTNLGVATGISLAGGSSDSDSDQPSESLGATIRKISFVVGLGTLVSVAISLFFACLFAVKLSLLAEWSSGAIVGLVIWATYFSLLVWVSSTTVGSLVGSVVNTATSGFQALVGTAAAMIGGKAASRQVVATAEAAAAAVRRELTAGFDLDPNTVRDKLEDYLEAIKPPELDLRKIRAEFEDLLKDPNLQELAQSGNLQDIDRQTLVELVSSRTDLSKREVNRIADQLEAAWKSSVKQVRQQKDSFTDFFDYLKSATREQLLGKDLNQRIDDVVKEMRKRREAEHPGTIAQTMTLGLNSLIGLVIGRTDLSDLDVEKIVGQLKTAKDQLGEQTSKVAAQISGAEKPTYSPVRADIENYLLNAYSWKMNQATVKQEFRDVLYDAEGDPEAIVQELEQINRTDFVSLLRERGVFTQEKINQVANSLEEVRREVVSDAKTALERARSIAVLADIEQYLLNTPKEDLTPEKIQLNFKPILEDADADYDQLSNRLAQFDRFLFERVIGQRGDIPFAETATIISELEIARNQVLQESQNVQAIAKAKIEQQWLKVQSYMRDTGKDELNPDAIKRELKLLLDDPEAGTSALRARASRFDRDTLVQLLSQRQDLSEEQANQIIDEVEGIWTQIRYAPQELVGKAKEQYDQATTAIADYLRNTGKAELNPEGIKRDLQKLLDDPQAGAKAIRRRLAMMDRDTLVKLLSQREDLSKEQVNQTIDEVQANLRGIVKAPRRLARRTQEKVQDFQGTIADYLRSTDREELNPEGIQRDVQLLLNDPRHGTANLRERLAHFDRDTLVALLSQREDISQEDVNRIIDQFLVVRERILEQLQSIQYQIQSVIDGIFAKIRDYLNSMERPELNYEGIQRDLRLVFDDPQAGFDALRDRLSQFDRDTLIAIMSSREDISQADAEHILHQVERTRDRVLQRAERLQQQAQLRLEQVRREAQRQMEETRKAAATAAWWLFCTALVSAIAAACGGAIGVMVRSVS